MLLATSVAMEQEMELKKRRLDLEEKQFNLQFSQRSSENKSPSFNSNDGKCVICYDQKANVLLVDCGHLTICFSCSEKLQVYVCPSCRTPIAKTPIRVFS